MSKAKKIVKNDPVVNNDSDDENEPVEVSSRQNKQAAFEEFQKLQQQLQKQKQQKDKKKQRKHNKLINLHDDATKQTTSKQESTSTNDDEDDILDMSVLQSVQEHDENAQRLSSLKDRQAQGKKRKFSGDEPSLFKSATNEELNQHKKRRVFTDLNLQVRIVPEKKDDSLDNLLSTTTSIDPQVALWARKHFILKVHRTTTAKWISEKRDTRTVAPCEVFVSSGTRPVHFHL